MHKAEGQEVLIKADQILFEQGQPSDGVYIILKGIVDLWHMDEDKKMNKIASLIEGELLGETSVIENTQRSVTAKAVTATKAIFISAETFRQRLSNPFVRFVVHTQSTRLRSFYTNTSIHDTAASDDDMSNQPQKPAVTIACTTPAYAQYFNPPLRIEQFPFKVGNIGTSPKSPNHTSTGFFFRVGIAGFESPHFEIVKRGEEIFVRDLGSAIGTYVHGVKYSRFGSSAVAKLRPGNSRISIANSSGDPVEFVISVPWQV